jgi:hypothetical protein
VFKISSNTVEEKPHNFCGDIWLKITMDSVL